VPSLDVLTRCRARSPQVVRLVLLAALGTPLALLAVGSPAPATPAPSLGSGVVLAEPDDRDVEPVALHGTVSFAPTRLPAREVSRSRPLVTTWARPVPGGITSPYGARWGAWHPGIDLQARTGTPIHVVTDGVVIGAGYLAGEGGYGQIVLVRHRGGFITAYAHMSKVLSHAGQRVHRGQVIGLVGSTGHVTGPHLHFEVRVNGVKVNPVPWLRRHGVRV
jgi:murein DD-endopeptidase MepM/ murein hydrolase activator NlpD